MDRDNIYIITLKKGAKHIDDGITFNEMLSYLKEKHEIEINEENRISFQTWFYKKFFEPRIDGQLKYYSTRSDILTGNTYEPSSNKKSFLKGEAYMELLDYLELQEARKSSRDANKNSLKAHKTAIFAIIISGLFAIVSIGISILNFTKSEDPKYNSIQYRTKLLQNDKNEIIEACFHIGENLDKEALPYLFDSIYDPRITHDLRFKGISVYQARMIAINKILGLNSIDRINYKPDTVLVKEFFQVASKLELVE